MRGRSPSSWCRCYHTTSHISIDHIKHPKQKKNIPRSAKFDLFEAIHNLVEVKNELGSVGDEQSVGAIETLGLQCVELFEERWEVNDDAVSN